MNEKKIAVVNVAAELGGTASLLYDFVDSLLEREKNSANEWYIFTSVIKTKEGRNIHNVRCPEIKKSKFHRMWWEYVCFPKLVKQYKIDTILSMQNNGLPVKNCRQIVYFHNVLLLQKKHRFSLIRLEEWKAAVLKAPYTRHSWKYADIIVTQGKSVKEQLSRYYPRKRIKVITPDVKCTTEGYVNESVKGFIYPAGPALYRNFETIINAVRQIEEKGLDIEILLTINGNENFYAKKIATLVRGIKSIRLIGRQPREIILRKYKNYGLIITSKLESFPLIIREAMMCQTVIVALDFPYVHDQIELTGYNRIYVAKQNGTDLAEHMIKAMGDCQRGNYVEQDLDGTNKLISILAYDCRDF